MNSTSYPQAVRQRPLSRSDFKAFRDIPTRWMDVDIYGHVNNVQYLSFFDTAVNGWYVANGLLDPRTSPEVFLVVETGCHYFAELTFPSVVSAGLKIEKLGSSSIVFRVGLFAGEEPETAAHGRFVHVLVDRKTRRPMPISENARGILSSLMT
ncbi:acyl-CoA thioester hydrolase [Labrenzia sp. EL_208]|uniref:Acyl-CoA thioester hydrolase, YbgC/YbaW family n=1 Tax=Roseibium album TaxID=311410 RepID=A0A0M6ZGJ5_9HYPH|nr:thioesterase family protein [Roseibium album]MBG6155432.1 acyl-CoA thioester hydrolase [Labrenzia sp. EL_162]MBG6176131.1 acyl-CoA thioester hydrolase [Labrenzia sp. EL_132]MBG6193967.1 acyl-CoA thioester hydrolase [Labrenzia sp. EL_159]MBG6201056.1 acyl-CoA thioester hydrolase [Labrenzia sp. EL_13]MBG6230746.1 acyl-CoA thioester hydrolase [Labrenzia sp. EL_208]